MDIKDILQRRGWFVISATRESAGPHDHYENQWATRQLVHHLDALDLAFLPCDGVYRGVEQGRSFLVFGPYDTGRQLCRIYDQESILTPDGLVDRHGNLLAQRVGDLFDEEAENADFFSRFADGTKWSAALSFWS